jgi:hypothetical protein
MFLFLNLTWSNMWCHSIVLAVATGTTISCSLDSWHGQVLSLSFFDVYAATGHANFLPNSGKTKFRRCQRFNAVAAAKLNFFSKLDPSHYNVKLMQILFFNLSLSLFSARAFIVMVIRHFEGILLRHSLLKKQPRKPGSCTIKLFTAVIYRFS